MYRAIIVDDESLARKDLIAVLSSFSHIEIVGEADSVVSARKLLIEYKPDLVFLDIQMPGETGFDLLEFIEPDIKIIFVTAFDEFAFRAFEVNAQDYLLKPVSAERLAITLERLETGSAPAHSAKAIKFKPDDYMFLKTTDSYMFIKISTIIKISAADDYTEIHLKEGEKILVHKTMKEWENRLPEQKYCRIHRSTIVNIDMVNSIEPWHNNSYLVSFKELEKPAIMSRRYFTLIKDRLG